MVIRKKAAEKKSVKKKIVKSVSKKDSVDEVTSSSYIVIDYPNEAEIINGLHYALRIGASNDGYVEISLMTANGFHADSVADIGGLIGRISHRDTIPCQQDL